MRTQSQFAGLRVAITGGTSGLGLALVRQLTEAGARVVFVARGSDRVERVAGETGAVGTGRRRGAQGRYLSAGTSDHRSTGWPRFAHQQRFGPWTCTAGASGRYGVRGVGSCVGGQSRGSVSADQGTVWCACRVGARGWLGAGRQRFQRCSSGTLRHLGCLFRQQGRPCGT